MSNKILELAYLRNQLVSHKFSEKDYRLLDEVKVKVTSGGSCFAGVATNAIESCESDLKNKNFESVSEELQLIHNFCFDAPNAWNADYFYTVELLSYLEKVSDVERIKKTISLVGKLASKD